MENLIDQLLTELHRSFDLLAEDLMRDRPDLANALRLQTMNIPRPPLTVGERASPPSPETACSELPPLLYGALDAGLVDAREFDRLMVLKTRAARTLRRRK
jgi:hypothetical protein